MRSVKVIQASAQIRCMSHCGGERWRTMDRSVLRTLLFRVHSRMPRLSAYVCVCAVCCYALVYISWSNPAFINLLTEGSRSLPLLSLKQHSSTSPLLSSLRRRDYWDKREKGGRVLTVLQKLLIANKARLCCGIEAHARCTMCLARYTAIFVSFLF